MKKANESNANYIIGFAIGLLISILLSVIISSCQKDNDLKTKSEPQAYVLPESEGGFLLQLVPLKTDCLDSISCSDTLSIFNGIACIETQIQKLKDGPLSVKNRTIAHLALGRLLTNTSRDTKEDTFIALEWIRNTCLEDKYEAQIETLKLFIE